MSDLRLMIDPDDVVCIDTQCALLGLSRSSYYYSPQGETEENLDLMRRMDEYHINYPFMGVMGMTRYLRVNDKQIVNPKRVRRLMRLMGLEAIYPKKRTSNSDKSHRVYPYLLRDISITKPNHVWCSDITYIPMAKGFMYLVAVMDWASRYVIAWDISNSMDTMFCMEALESALNTNGVPEIFNTDQGSQFTSNDFTSILLNKDIKISMDGIGRAIDNVFIERLWRSVKYEDVYLKSYQNGSALYKGLMSYFEFYNVRRGHEGLNGATPYEAYHGIA